MKRGTATAALVAVSLATSIARAQVVSLVKDFSGETYESVAIDDSGQSIYVVATSNQFGTNPGLQRQIFRWDAASGVGAQLTSFPAGVRRVSVSDDDQWLAFVSTGDLTGDNHDGSSELFVMKTDGTSLTQVTNDTSLAGDGVFTAMISGSGNRIAFISDTDPLGTNPGREPHVFAVDRGGSDLVQLAETYQVDVGVQISDDGTRVVYADQPNPGPTNIFGVASDGSTPPSLIGTAPDVVYSVRLSGDGGKVAFFADGISTVNYDGTDPHAVVGAAPVLSDDGQSLYYSAGGVWKSNPDGTGAVLVKADAPPLRYVVAAASGNGGRLAVHATGGVPPGGHNPDGGYEVVAMDDTGSTVHQLTDLNLPTGNNASFLVAAADASRVFFISAGDLTGANPEHYGELFTLLANGTGLAQVTEGGVYQRDYSVSDTNVVVFWGWNDLTGQNACHTAQVFKVDLGGAVTQLTNNCPTSDYSYMPRIRSDGQFIFFQGSHKVGSNLDGSRELFRMTITGTGITPLTSDNSSTSKFPVISATTSPTWIAYLCDDNLSGQNPYHRPQVCRINSNGTGFQRVTGDPNYNSYATDISGDGSKIVVESDADLAGENPDHRVRIFYYDVPTTSFHQLTHGSGNAYNGNISRDGSWVYYQEYDRGYNLLRVSTSTGVVERVPGFTHGPSTVTAFGVDGTGNKAFFFGENFLNKSPSGASLFLADQFAKPAFTIGKDAPTLLSWDPDPESTRYDVVRGDVASLAIAGSTVDLGPVACVEDDSPDNATVGNEDAAQPSPGQTFFYLYRGTKGSPPVTASWGQGTGARERIAAACNP